MFPLFDRHVNVEHVQPIIPPQEFSPSFKPSAGIVSCRPYSGLRRRKAAARGPLAASYIHRSRRDRRCDTACHLIIGPHRIVAADHDDTG